MAYCGAPPLPGEPYRLPLPRRDRDQHARGEPRRGRPGRRGAVQVWRRPAGGLQVRGHEGPAGDAGTGEEH